MSQTVGEHLLRRLIAWRSAVSTATPATASTASSPAFTQSATSSSSSRPAMRSWPPSRPAPTQSSPDRPGSAWPPPDPGPCTCSTVCTTRALDHQPVVAIVGQQARSSLGADYQQEIDLVSLYKDVARDFVQVLNVPAQIDLLIDRAMRVAAAIPLGHRDHRPQRRPGGPTRAAASARRGLLERRLSRPPRPSREATELDAARESSMRANGSRC